MDGCVKRSGARGFQVIKEEKKQKSCEGLRPSIFILISRKCGEHTVPWKIKMDKQQTL